jgi:HD-like signal output (HDOD) protein
VLKTVNSVLYGLRRSVADIHSAVKVLGVNPLRSLVLSLSLPSMQVSAFPRELLRRYWQMSVSGALISRELATLLRRPSSESDLVSGLLRDLGMLVLRQVDAEQYDTILNRPPDELALQQSQLEEQVFHMNHGEVGAYLLRRWGLPDDITEPVRIHHQPQLRDRLDPAIQNRVLIVSFGAQVAQLQATPDNPDVVRGVLDSAREWFDMGEQQLRTFLEPIKDKIAEFAGILELDIGDCVEYAKVLVSGAEALARLTVQASLSQAQVYHEDDPESSDDDYRETGKVHMGPGPSPSTHDEPRIAVSPSELNSTQDRQAAVDGGSSIGSNRQTRRQQDNHPPTVGDKVAEVCEWCKRFFSPPRRPGDMGTLANYEINNLLGCGGMGAVFKAFEPALQRRVAIKLLLPQLAGCSQSRMRFAREAQSAAAIVHDHVVSVFNVGELRGIPFIVMEYVEGTPLDARLETEKQLPFHEILRIGMQTADALSAAHARGLVHRDIKPANILLERATRKVKITDFGLARAKDHGNLTQSGVLVGTPFYMSPEQILGEPLDHRSDLFSLGTTLYVMCTGKLPFQGETLISVLRNVCDGQPAPVHELNPSVPEWMDVIVRKLHAKRPEDRYQTAAELKALLGRRWAGIYTKQSKL